MGFVVKARELFERNSVALLVLCCCDILEAMEISVVRPDVATKRPRVRCTGTREDIISWE